MYMEIILNLKSIIHTFALAIVVRNRVSNKSITILAIEF